MRNVPQGKNEVILKPNPLFKRCYWWFLIVFAAEKMNKIGP